jgi:competence protein ComEA
MKIKPILPQHQKGILMLIGMIVGVVAVLFICAVLLYLVKKGDITTLEKSKEISSQSKDLEEKNKAFFNENKAFLKSTKTKHFSFKVFDPNTVTQQELVSYGLSEKQAMNIINYRNAGGKYRKKEDLKKLYCMSDYLYSQMSPYVEIKQQTNIEKNNNRVTNQSISNKNNSNTSFTPNKTLIVFDLNSADTIDLQMIRGVGVVFARKIYKYGKKLGGYVKVEQLKEVWGMTDERYNEIKKQVMIKPITTRKVNINTMNIKELTSHPYIDYYLAKEIIKFHQTNGAYKNIEELKKIHLVDEATFNKLSPYIEVK